MSQNNLVRKVRVNMLTKCNTTYIINLWNHLFSSLFMDCHFKQTHVHNNICMNLHDELTLLLCFTICCESDITYLMTKNPPQIPNVHNIYIFSLTSVTHIAFKTRITSRQAFTVYMKTLLKVTTMSTFFTTSKSKRAFLTSYIRIYIFII